MWIKVNGHVRELRDKATPALFVDEFVKENHPFVVEINGTIVRKENFHRFELAEGDSVEILSLVGGG